GISKMNWKAVAQRAAWNFAQAFLGVVVLAGTDFVHVGTLKAAGVAGAAAVFSFLKNVVAKPTS
ncbi:MAG: holin, partial [Thermoplasmatota archaeon]